VLWRHRDAYLFHICHKSPLYALTGAASFLKIQKAGSRFSAILPDRRGLGGASARGGVPPQA
jgi:hypothetical protein